MVEHKGVARGVSRLPGLPPPPPSKKYIRNFTPPSQTHPGRNFKLLAPPPPRLTSISSAYPPPPLQNPGSANMICVSCPSYVSCPLYFAVCGGVPFPASRHIVAYLQAVVFRLRTCTILALHPARRALTSATTAHVSPAWHITLQTRMILVLIAQRLAYFFVLIFNGHAWFRYIYVMVEMRIWMDSESIRMTSEF